MKLATKASGLACSALFAFALVAAAPARASTITDTISFTDAAIYGVSDPQNAASFAHGYQSLGVASGTFTITFDPTQLYLTQPLGTVITGLTYSVTDPFFSGSPLTLNAITQFAFDGAGTLTLYSDPALEKTLDNTQNITIGINGWAYGPGSEVWFSQPGFAETLTTNGAVSIVETTPLPAALPLFAGGLGVIGLLARRRKRKAAA